MEGDWVTERDKDEGFAELDSQEDEAMETNMAAEGEDELLSCPRNTVFYTLPLTEAEYLAQGKDFTKEQLDGLLQSQPYQRKISTCHLHYGCCQLAYRVNLLELLPQRFSSTETNIGFGSTGGSSTDTSQHNPLASLYLPVKILIDEKISMSSSQRCILFPDQGISGCVHWVIMRMGYLSYGESSQSLPEEYLRCGQCWYDGKFDADCPECGGFALQRPCPICNGQCSNIWRRDIKSSHSFHEAHWDGKCGLPPEVQQVFMLQNLTDSSENALSEGMQDLSTR